MENLKFTCKRTRFAKMTVDTVFKRIFGSEDYKLATIGLIKGILGIDVVDVRFLRNELVRETQDSRGAFIDVLAECQDGTRVMVEMQNSRQDFFLQRMVYYASKIIAMQGDIGEWDYNFSETYIIAFLNFDIMGIVSGEELLAAAPNRYSFTYETREINTGALLPNSTRYKILLLEKFDKKIEELSTYPEKLLYLLQHASELTDVPENLQGDPYIDTVLAASEMAGFTKEQELQYFIDMRNEWDIINERKLAVREAVEKNTAEVTETIAKAFISKGMSPEIVSECTKLDIDTVKKLAEQN
ncbi:MAG: Rpn family recombination-promoting nuclease/putative transposase [Bacteroidales bacterium]|nr:Rpn family recombination-promoting nuclease/putative transposase [Bacteroidales bacterium]